MNVSDVSKKINVTANTLRYYEQEHLIPPIKRNANGYRDYTEYDLNWIYFVKCMRDAMRECQLEQQLNIHNYF